MSTPSTTTVFPSKHPPVEIPSEPLTEFVFRHFAERGERQAIVDLDTGRGYTYAELVRLTDRVAARLVECGLSPGERVAILLPNVPEFPIVFHGIVTIGGVVTALNPAYKTDEVAHQLRDSGARFVVTDAHGAETVRAASGRTHVEEVFVLGEPGADDALAPLLGAGSVPRVKIDVATALAALPYSSGTTGLPKGVMLSHRNLVANLVQIDRSQMIGEGDVLAGILPFFHIYAMTFIVNLSLWRGATIASVRRFSVDAMIRAIEQYRVTRLYAAPPMVMALAQHPDVDRADLSSLRVVLSGAAPLPGEVARLCQERIGCAVVQGYGLTEASPCTHLTDDLATGVPHGSVGCALPSTECRVVDVVTGADLGPDEDGELWIRGPQVMLGYLDNPEATAAAIDAEGFLHTGDVVRIDDSGNCFVVDRLKELIKHKGFQIAPAELEAVLLEHEDVADAAVIGIPDERAGEVPYAFVTAKPGRTPDPTALCAFVGDRVAEYKRVASVELVDTIPRTASGKIQRRVLRESLTTSR